MITQWKEKIKTIVTTRVVILIFVHRNIYQIHNKYVRLKKGITSLKLHLSVEFNKEKYNLN